MVHGVDLPETRFFSLLGGIEGAGRDVAFQGIQRPGAAFPFQPQGFLVLSEAAVYGRGVYRPGFFRDFPGDGEGRSLGGVPHLLAHQRGE
jgi:hypothetical protein